MSALAASASDRRQRIKKYADTRASRPVNRRVHAELNRADGDVAVGFALQREDGPLEDSSHAREYQTRGARISSSLAR